MTKSIKKGRPQGAKTADRDVVDIIATRCQSCGSTERTPYHEKREIHGAGQAPDGKPYSAVTLRPTRCATCGQHRIDREYEYIPGSETGRPN